MEYDLKLEKELVKLGFKKNWLSDKSGYWMEKKFKLKNLNLKFVVESDRKIFILGIKTGYYQGGRLTMNKYYDDLAKYRCDIKTIKTTVKKYK